MWSSIKEYIQNNQSPFEFLQLFSETVFSIFVAIILYHFKFIIFAPERRDAYIAEVGGGILMDLVIIIVALIIFMAIRVAFKDNQRKESSFNAGKINKEMRQGLEKIKNKK
jgi:hypothetical protein